MVGALVEAANKIRSPLTPTPNLLSPRREAWSGSPKAARNRRATQSLPKPPLHRLPKRDKKSPLRFPPLSGLRSSRGMADGSLMERAALTLIPKAEAAATKNSGPTNRGTRNRQISISTLLSSCSALSLTNSPYVEAKTREDPEASEAEAVAAGPRPRQTSSSRPSNTSKSGGKTASSSKAGQAAPTRLSPA